MPETSRLSEGDVDSAIASFVANLRSLSFAFPLTIRAIEDIKRTEIKNLPHNPEEVPEDIAQLSAMFRILPNMQERVFSEVTEVGLEIFSAARRFARIETARELVMRSFVITLNTQMDELVGQIARAICRAKPHVMNFHSRTVQLEDIIESGGLENFQKRLVEEEIDAVLRRGHSGQIEWIEKGLKINVRGTVPSWADFMEVAELRNLFTHTNGVVSQQFLTAAKKHGINVSPGVVLGEQLRMSAGYFGRAYKATLRHGLAVGYLCRHRIADDSKIVAFLLGTLAALMEDTQTEVAKDLLDEVVRYGALKSQTPEVIEQLRALVTKAA